MNNKFAKAPRLEFWGAVIGAGASLLGGMMANESRERVADNTSAFNAEQAAINRDWQAWMSNTSYQRAIGDMRSAGLNPMLAYSQGGASVPSGSTASGVTPEVQDVIGPAVATAQQIKRTEADIERTRAETDLLKAQRDKASAEVIQVGSQTQKIVEEVNQIRASTSQLEEAAEELRLRGKVHIANVEKAIQDIKESYAREDLTRVKEILGKLSIAEAKVMEEFFKSAVGEANPAIKVLLGLISALKGIGR